jgi:dipeptidyl aminopeptidase/acylaminoacyl peptidase
VPAAAGPGRRRAGRRAWYTGLAGLAALALTGTALTGVAQAAYPGQDGRIAFVRAGHIYTIEPDGTGLQQLTTGSGDSGPRWSPNGKDIAYNDNGNLWIMHANGSHQRRVTDAAPRFTDARPSWSPNGRYLAFVRTARRASSGYLTRYDTVTHRFVPSAEDQTHKATRLLDPDWFTVDPAFGTDALTTVESCTSAGCTHKGIRLQIGQPTIVPGAYQAVYSPVGRQIAYVLNSRRGTPEIYIAPNSQVAQSFATLLTSGTQPDWQPLPAPAPAT